MQAIILAAGKSSRFSPFADGRHKTMISLLGIPILAYTIAGIKKAGIKNIILVVSSEATFRNYFGDGSNIGINLTYVIQQAPDGMGDALLKAKKYIEDEYIVLGGNHVNSELLIKEILSNKKNTNEGIVFLTKRENPWEYGVVRLAGNDVAAVVEKPIKGTEPSSYCLVSIYYLPMQFLKVLENEKQNHFNFEDALDTFAKTYKLRAIKTGQEITTLKYPWDLLAVKNYLLKNCKKSISKDAKIAKSVEFVGNNIVVESGVTILEGVRIKGPCYIGKNALIGNNALLRDGVDLEDNSVIGSYMEAKNCLIMKNSTTHSGFIGDSVIGEGTKIGAQFCTANIRIDRKTVSAEVKDKKIDSGQKYLGAMIGNNVKIGIKVSTMPGIIIGNNATIGPSTNVLRNVEDNTRYYTKFQELVSEK